MERHVVAMGGGGFLMDDPALDRFVCGLVSSPRPKVCLLPTASGDAATVIDRFFESFGSRSFEASVLRLFDRDVADISSFLGEQDIVYVGGGNTAAMLAIWRVHGVDAGLRSAWEAGVVMTGMSAGANCWFEACTTDSFLLGRADPLRDGLGIVEGSFTPHLGSEPARRPSLHEAIRRGELPPGLACEDFAAIHVVGGQVREAVASRPGAGAYRVGLVGGQVSEEPIEVRRLADG